MVPVWALLPFEAALWPPSACRSQANRGGRPVSCSHTVGCAVQPTGCGAGMNIHAPCSHAARLIAATTSNHFCRIEGRSDTMNPLRESRNVLERVRPLSIRHACTDRTDFAD